MIVPSDLLAFYNQVRPFLEYVRANALATISRYASQENIPISGRIKTMESVAEKIETGRYDNFAELDDLVAFTLVVPNARKIKEATVFLSSVFHVHEIKESTKTEKSPEIFRFDSTRLVCTIRRIETVDADLSLNAYDILFEIQVRTVFEHAWIVATHDLACKSNSIDWRRLRVAAQLKAVAESLDASVAAFDALVEAVHASPWPKLDDRLTVQDTITKLFEQNILPEELRPKDLSRFCENIVSLVRIIRPKCQVRECLHLFEDQLRSAELQPMPLSLSLYQLFLGTMCRAGKLDGDKQFPYHVTQELTTIFPEARRLRSAFSYSFADPAVPSLIGPPLTPPPRRR